MIESRAEEVLAVEGILTPRYVMSEQAARAMDSPHLPIRKTYEKIHRS